MRHKTNQLITNKEVAHLLRSVAAAHLIKNKNRFRVIAYENAADVVEHLGKEIIDIWKEGKLKDIQGIGEIIADSLDEFFRKGKAEHFERVKKGIPETVFDLMKVPTIGPKKAYILVKELGLTNPKTLLKDLNRSAQKGKIAPIPSFGKRSQDSIIEALSNYEVNTGKHHRIPFEQAKKIADEIVTYLKKNKDVKRIDVLGSLRRKNLTIGDIDIAVISKKGLERSVVDYFIAYPKKKNLINSGQKKVSMMVYPSIRVDLRVQDAKSYGSMLQYFTGNKDHNIRLREFALGQGYSLSEYGIKDLRSKDKKLYEFPNEKKFYNFLGLNLISPEERVGRDEIEKARIKSK